MRCICDGGLGFVGYRGDPPNSWTGVMTQLYHLMSNPKTPHGAKVANELMNRLTAMLPRMKRIARTAKSLEALMDEYDSAKYWVRRWR